ncbi:hypothetical protein P3342_011395 [Pyrenophora teres f. teres]|nr:hypothetical protein P3342_011395 [Pyrenophora teres f. teres]
MRCGSRRALGVVEYASFAGDVVGVGVRVGVGVGVGVVGRVLLQGERVRRQDDARHCRQAHGTESNVCGSTTLAGAATAEAAGWAAGDSLDGLVWGVEEQ